MKKTRPKNLWVLWLQGLENTPKIVKECVQSRQRHNPHWKLVLLDSDEIIQNTVTCLAAISSFLQLKNH